MGLPLLHTDTLPHQGSHSPVASLPHRPFQQPRGKSSCRWEQPCLEHLCSQHQAQLLSWGSLLSLSRQVTRSQMPLGLEANILHLPPAHDPVPVLDYPRLLHFFHLSLPGVGRGSTRTSVAQASCHAWLWLRGAAGAGEAGIWTKRAEPCLLPCKAQGLFSKNPRAAGDKAAPLGVSLSPQPVVRAPRSPR